MAAPAALNRDAVPRCPFCCCCCCSAGEMGGRFRFRVIDSVDNDGCGCAGPGCHSAASVSMSDSQLPTITGTCAGAAAGLCCCGCCCPPVACPANAWPPAAGTSPYLRLSVVSSSFTRAKPIPRGGGPKPAGAAGSRAPAAEGTATDGRVTKACITPVCVGTSITGADAGSHELVLLPLLLLTIAAEADAPTGAAASPVVRLGRARWE
jgi:hypothetical protein